MLRTQNNYVYYVHNKTMHIMKQWPQFCPVLDKQDS